MKIRQSIAAISVAALVASITACSSGGGSDESSEAGIEGTPSGEITVLTQRTDLVQDGTLEEYAARFEEQYPGTTVEFEGITNYEQDVTTRLSSGNIGDVLALPTSVSPDQYSAFFEPLGDTEELSSTYRFMSGKSYEGTGYGIAQFGNTMGFVYNKKVWSDAGVTEIPTTPEEFLTALEAIKANTDAIPYYTNYKDQWPLSQWNGDPSLLGAGDALNALNSDPAPWSNEDSYLSVSDGLLFDIVADGLSEPDPTTTAWEGSKTMLATGEVASMYLGSWAIQQMKDAATTAGTDPEDIGYLPFPYQVDGKFVATLAPDYYSAINSKSENKATAMAWIEWFTTESGYAEKSGAIATNVDSENPATLSDFTDLGVEYLEQDPFPAGEENVQADLMKDSQIDITGGIYRQKLVDIARGAADGDKDSAFADLDERWAAAQQ